LLLLLRVVEEVRDVRVLLNDRVNSCCLIRAVFSVAGVSKRLLLLLLLLLFLMLLLLLSRIVKVVIECLNPG